MNNDRCVKAHPVTIGVPCGIPIALIRLALSPISTPVPCPCLFSQKGLTLLSAILLEFPVTAPYTQSELRRFKKSLVLKGFLRCDNGEILRPDLFGQAYVETLPEFGTEFQARYLQLLELAHG